MAEDLTGRFKYKAFISYSHKDKKRTWWFGKESWGIWLHRKLEHYKVPKGLKSGINDLPEKLGTFFLDSEEIRPSSNLSETLTEALKQSEYLIVICSPNSARSEYVNNEILQFKKLGRDNNILSLIIAGEPNASKRKGLKPEDECFPDALVTETVSHCEEPFKAKEPIAADIRKGMGGKKRAKIKLIASLLKVDFDDLWQREEKYNRKIRIATYALLISSILVLSGFLYYAYYQKKVASNAQVSLLLDNASKSIEENDPRSAITYLVRAFRIAPKNREIGVFLSIILTQNNFPLQVAVFQHEKNINTAAFSPNGELILTASDDKTARLWNSKTGKPFKAFRHDRPIKVAIFSPDGKTILTGSEEGIIKIWNAYTGDLIKEIYKHNKAINQIFFSFDGKSVITASEDNTARLWDTNTWESLQGSEILTHDNSINTAFFSRDNTRIITSSKDGTARIWDGRTGKPFTNAKPMEHSSSVNWASFSNDGKIIVTASSDGTARLWDGNTGEPLAIVKPMVHKKSIIRAIFSPDGEKVATASFDNTGRVWETKTGNPYANSKPILHNGPLTSLVFSLDGKKVLTASRDGTARIWDALSGDHISECMIHSGKINSAVFNPDEKYVVTGSDDNSAILWNLLVKKPLHNKIGKLNISSRPFYDSSNKALIVPHDSSLLVFDLLTGEQKFEITFNSQIVCSDISSNGKLLGIATKDNIIRVFDLELGRIRPKLKFLTKESISLLKFSYNCNNLLAVSDKCVKVWNTENGDSLDWRINRDLPIKFADFSPDAKWILTITKVGEVHLWNKNLLEPITLSYFTKPYYGANKAEFSKDSKFVVTTADDNTALVWVVKIGKVLSKPMEHNSYINTATFSSDGTKVITASSDNTVRIWDTKTGNPISEPLKHNGKVNSAALSPDGKLIVSASDDGTIRLWGIRKGRAISAPLVHDSPVKFAEFTPDGMYILTTTKSSFYIWDIGTGLNNPPEWFIDLAEAISGQKLNDNGETEPIDSCWLRIRKLKSYIDLEFKENPDDKWLCWGKWFFDNSETRKISPFLNINLPPK